MTSVSGTRIPGLRYDLPVWQTIKDSYRTVFVDYVHHLPKAALAPFLLLILIDFVLAWLDLYPSPYIEPEPDDAWGQAAKQQFRAFLGMVPTVILVVAWQRLVLLGPRCAAPGYALKWNNRHWKYFGYFCLYILVSTLPMFPALLIMFSLAFLHDYFGWYFLSEGMIFFISLLFALVGLVFMFLGMVRLSLVFPAIAVDLRFGLLDAWQQAKDQTGRMFATYLVLGLPLLLVSWFFLWLLADALSYPIRVEVTDSLTHGPFSFAIATAITQLLMVINMSMFATCVSFCFRSCTDWTPPELTDPTNPNP